MEEINTNQILENNAAIMEKIMELQAILSNTTVNNRNSINEIKNENITYLLDLNSKILSKIETIQYYTKLKKLLISINK